jgi:hypothetical protein
MGRCIMNSSVVQGTLSFKDIRPLIHSYTGPIVSLQQCTKYKNISCDIFFEMGC